MNEMWNSREEGTHRLSLPYSAAVPSCGECQAAPVQSIYSLINELGPDTGKRVIGRSPECWQILK